MENQNKNPNGAGINASEKVRFVVSVYNTATNEWNHDGGPMTKSQLVKYLAHKESLKGNEEYTITIFKKRESV